MNKRLRTSVLAAIVLPVCLFGTGCNDQPSQPQDVNIVVHVPAPVVITREVQVRVPSDEPREAATATASMPAAPRTTSTTASALETAIEPVVEPVTSAVSPTSVEETPAETGAALGEASAAATPAETSTGLPAVTDTLVADAVSPERAAAAMPPADSLVK